MAIVAIPHPPKTTPANIMKPAIIRGDSLFSITVPNTEGLSDGEGVRLLVGAGVGVVLVSTVEAWAACSELALVSAITVCAAMVGLSCG
jgi:hypothetical protein